MYWVDGERHDVAALRDSERLALLKPHHLEAGRIFCDCMRTGTPNAKVEMHLRMVNKHLHLVKAKNTGKEHHRSCLHASLTQRVLEKLGYAADVIKLDSDETTVVKLTHSLSNGQPSKEVIRASGPSFGGGKRSIQSRMTLCGLLHAVYERSMLNRHFRHQAPPAEALALQRLKNAARSIRLSGTASTIWGIEEFLLLPKDVHPDQERYNSAKLRSTQTRQKKVLFLFSLASASAAEDLMNNRGQFDLRSVFGCTVRTDKPNIDLHGLLGNSFAAESSWLKQNKRIVVLGIAHTAPAGGAKFAVIEKVVAVSVTEAWIPIDSSYEAELADFLVNTERSFEKPLRYDATKETQVFPDFRLTDTEFHVSLEVYGMSHADYLLRKEDKRTIYQEEYPGRYWEWDVLAQRDLARWLQTHPLPT